MKTIDYTKSDISKSLVEKTDDELLLYYEHKASIRKVFGIIILSLIVIITMVIMSMFYVEMDWIKRVEVHFANYEPQWWEALLRFIIEIVAVIFMIWLPLLSLHWASGNAFEHRISDLRKKILRKVEQVNENKR